MYHTTADVIKLFMSILVVMIHSTFFSLWKLEELAVPVFFIYSGYYLYGRIQGAGTDTEKKNIFKRFIRRMIILYGLCEIVYSPFAIESLLDEGVSFKNVAVILRNYVLVGEQAFSWHLWYLLASIYGGIFLMLFAKTRRGLFILCGLCTILFTADHLFHFMASWHLHTLLFKYPHPRLSSGLWLMSAGGCLAQCSIPARKRGWFVILFVLCMLSINFFAGSKFYLIPIASSLLVLLSLHFEFHIPQDISRTIRKASSFIYIAHMLFVAVLLKFTSIGYGLTLWIAVLLASGMAFCIFRRAGQNLLRPSGQ